MNLRYPVQHWSKHLYRGIYHSLTRCGKRNHQALLCHIGALKAISGPPIGGHRGVKSKGHVPKMDTI